MIWNGAFAAGKVSLMEEFAAPILIIAMPQLSDPNFHHTVVLLVEKNDEGAFGLVINRAGDNRVSELCTNLKVGWGGGDDALALYGGPVGNEQGFLLHGGLPDDVMVPSRQVIPGIYIASDMETFRTLCVRPPAEFRILLGYAGWGPGQLETEMVAGAWLATEANADLVFGTPLGDIWEKSLRQIGVDPNMLVAGGGVH